MNRNKIIIYSLVVLIALGVGSIAYFLLIANKSSQQTTILPDPNSDKGYYLVSLTQNEGSLFGKIQKGDTALVLNSENISKYISLSFSSTNERMYIMCPENFKATNYVSTTNNKISEEPGVGISMELTKGQDNTVSLICSPK